jgi:UDP-N-acetylglucosamine 4,6-dehydratase/5-epimerase
MTDYTLSGKNILVTGGTGFFGQKIVEILLKYHSPKKIVVYSRDEYKQHVMSTKLSPVEHPSLRYFIGDVRDEARLKMGMRGIDCVIHSAAMKQVMAAEYNPLECIATNITGAENIVSAALHNNVERVVALSTDKAANPINLYGASKLAADKIFIAANNLSGDSPTRFCSVRYGNVSGSRGSIIPMFKKLIDEGADFLPITDPRMTRFWILLEEGVQFVLDSLVDMHGGEIFIPKIPSIKIVDLATAMAPNLPQEIIGIRPGEKINEILISDDDSRHTLDQGKRYVIEPEINFWNRPSQEGKLVENGFVYQSNQNSQWLSIGDLSKII